MSLPVSVVITGIDSMGSSSRRSQSARGFRR